MLTFKDVKNQSLTVYKQFGESKWKPFALLNSHLPRLPKDHFKNIGIGKFLVLCAMGESLEMAIPYLQVYRDRVDILTCDKGFGYLIDNGIMPDYVVICDTNIPFVWVEKYLEYSKDVVLLCTPYANIEWTHTWKGQRYFYINRDAIESEKVFQDIFKDNMRLIPAGSNVSNAMFVLMTGLDETNRVNYTGYEKFLFTGYDYSWRPDGKYYAGNNPMPKRFYMHLHTLLDINNDVVFTSSNLMFSAKWMTQYFNTFKPNAVNCSDRGLLAVNRARIEDELKRIPFMNGKNMVVKNAYNELVNTALQFDKQRQGFEKLKKEVLYGCRV